MKYKTTLKYETGPAIGTVSGFIRNAEYFIQSSFKYAMTWYYSYFKTLNALLDILHVGKTIIQEVSSCYNFVADIVIAETLRRRSMYVTRSHAIVSRELETEKQIMDDVLLTILEFQKVISEEHLNNFES